MVHESNGEATVHDSPPCTAVAVYPRTVNPPVPDDAAQLTTAYPLVTEATTLDGAVGGEIPT
jgi:hypothetical protein